MKLALCLYGQPRFIHNPAAFESHKTNILDKYDTDVFCHFWYDPDLDIYNRSDFSGAPGGCSADYVPKVHKDTVERITSFFKPKAYLHEKPKVFPPPDPLPPVFKRYEGCFGKEAQNNFSNMKSQMYSWQKAIELCVDKGDGSYDWVLVSRYDNKFGNFPDIAAIPKGTNTTYAHATYDFTVINPAFCKGLAPYDHFDEMSYQMSDFDAAQHKRMALIKNGSGLWETHEWTFTLVRSEE